MAPQVFKIQGTQGDVCASQQGHGLIMTATLAPPAAAVARYDPTERMNDYLNALRHYLGLPNTIINRILFVDNSNSNLRPLVEMTQKLGHAKTVEFISFSGNDHPHQFGKAYGEFKLMDYGLAHSTLFGASDLVWKTTGRLKILNFGAIHKASTQRPFDVLCDLHNVPWVGAGKWREPHHMDLRVFAFRRAAYDLVFRDLWRAQEAGLDAEFMYHRMRQAHPGLHVLPRFPVQLQLQGISGRHQRDYASNSQRTKDMIRSVARQVTPWLWL